MRDNPWTRKDVFRGHATSENIGRRPGRDPLGYHTDIYIYTYMFLRLYEGIYFGWPLGQPLGTMIAGEQIVKRKKKVHGHIAINTDISYDAM